MMTRPIVSSDRLQLRRTILEALSSVTTNTIPIDLENTTTSPGSAWLGIEITPLENPVLLYQN